MAAITPFRPRTVALRVAGLAWRRLDFGLLETGFRRAAPGR